ncbi:TolC family protein [Lyngbya confervoides]|uniref:TolC family protein n=1 Tax=Lyngbya confervoides BDU141951 TaxID=1574623 RepID=A0ABD4T592_9CYAN|nr:TolC family protein [Lyngbya confervoides]MCM1983853.1 TolC family protein [Lyngbya confervoides BDU141951]
MNDLTRMGNFRRIVARRALLLGGVIGAGIIGSSVSVVEPMPISPMLISTPFAPARAEAAPSVAAPSVAAPSVAQALPPASRDQTLTLETATEIAERNNEELKVAKLQVERSQAALEESEAAKLPFVTARGSAFRSDNANFSLNPAATPVRSGEQAQVQRQTQLNAQRQRQRARQQFRQQLQRLRVLLRGDTDLSGQDNFDQQVTELQQRAGESAILPSPDTVGPLSPFDSFSPTSVAALNNLIQNTIRASVSLNYNILTGGQRSATIRAAQKQLEFAQLDVDRLRLQLRQNVANDYYDLQEARALLRVALDAVRNAQASLRNTLLREQAGVSTQFEVLQAQVQLANAQQALTFAEGLQLIAQRQLAETLSLPSTVNLVPTDAVAARGRWSMDLPESILVALNNRVELDQILLTREIAQERRTIAQASLRPRLRTFAGLSASASDAEQGVGDLGFQGEVGYNLGLQVDVNTFDGGESRAQVQAEDENIRIAETQYADQKNQIRFAVEQGYFSLEENLESIETARNERDFALESLALAQLRLQAGIGTQLEVIQAETDLTRAEGNLISAILDYNRALAALQRATSNDLPVQPFEPENP